MLSLKKNTLTLEDAENLSRFAKTDYFKRMLTRISQRLDDGYDVDVHFQDGDLKVDNFDAFVESANGYVFVVIDGDLEVKGTYTDYEHEPETLVLVTGVLSAENAAFLGFLEVQGDVSIKSCLVGQGNDCNATIFGDLRTHFLHTGDHYFKVHGNAEVEYASSARLDASNEIKTMTDDEIHAIIDPDLYEGEDDDGEFYLDYLDDREIAGRIRSGGEVLNSKMPKP